jgi:Kef-type K+ transport system membrane component KefB
MASVVASLGQSSNGGSSLGWNIGQPVLAAVLLTLLVPVATKFVIGPIYRRFLHEPLNNRAPYGQTLMIVLVLAALCSIAAYSGTSILYGAYLAGTVLAYLDVMINEVIRQDLTSSSSVPSASATFASTYNRLFGPVHHNLLEPLFFASVGFAIPFRDAWRGHLIWRGIVYSLLMVVGKVVVGLCIPLWTALPAAYRSVRVQLRKPQPQEHVPVRLESPSIGDVWSAAFILGSAMIARGEIGLLILQLGYAQSGHLSDEGFIVGTWAVVLNTLIGPLAVGALMRRFGERVIAGPWGKSL